MRSNRRKPNKVLEPGRAGGRSGGFTLIELVLVIAIITVVAAIALPRYADALERYRADTAARRLAADLGYARSQARTSGKPQVVSFNVTARSYSMAGVTDLRGKLGTYTVGLGESPFHLESMKLELGGATQITFDPYGGASVGGTIKVRTPNITRQVILNASAGKVSLK